MTAVIIIPSRYASTRLPAKPLASIAGRIMVERVWQLAKAVKQVEEVIIATDHQDIIKACNAFGAKSLLTDKNCRNGTERCWDALQKLEQKPNIIINMQGDAPITPPWVVQALVDGMMTNSDWQIATAAVQLSWKERQELINSKKQTPSSGTTVVFDHQQKALYFSKHVLPFARKERNESELSPTWRHIGLYAYRYEALKKYLSLKESPAEKTEGLEQLRALENGMPIHIVPVDYQGRTHGSVDSPEDILVVENIIRKEGELIDFP